MSIFTKNYRFYLQCLRKYELNSIEVNTQLDNLRESTEQRQGAQRLMEFKKEVPVGASLEQKLYPMISRNTLRHSKFKKRCDWSKNSRGARRTRQIGLPSTPQETVERVSRLPSLFKLTN